MKTELESPATEARRKLEELGGRTAQDLGLGRIVVQLLVYFISRPRSSSEVMRESCRNRPLFLCLVWLPILAL
jgi:hypothetical protein